MSSQLQTMHEEILYLRSQVALLQSQLASNRDKYDEDQVNKISNVVDIDQTLNSPRDRSNYTSDDLCETAELFEVPPSTANDDSNRFLGKGNNRNVLPLPRCTSSIAYGSINSLNKPQNNSTSIDISSPKFGDKFQSRRNKDDHRSLTSSDAISGGILSNHLVSNYLQPDQDTESSDSPQYQTEIQRLQRRIDHLRIQNTVLTLTLAESKSHCNHLYLLCGKYESNAIALHQALSFSDRAIEAYDVMLALLESRLGILEETASANESRKAAEAVARHLLNRLECDDDLHGNSLGPWQEAIVINANSASNAIPWTSDDDAKLRSHVSKLKGQRASIQNTVVTLESPFYDESEKLVNSCTEATKLDNRRMDLETAVLMQELMSMREEMSEIKCRAEQTEREKNAAIQQFNAMQSTILTLQAQIADSEALLALNSKVRLTRLKCKN